MSGDPGKIPRRFNDGTSQGDRFPDALDPLHFKIDDRSTEDYLALASEMAGKLLLEDEETWADANLFPALPEIPANLDFFGIATRAKRIYWERQLTAIESREDNPPHLALFIAFLKLLRHVQGDLNALGKAHLDYYYRQVLGFRPRPAEPDHVTVFFELAKDVAEHRLPAGTELDAGEDETGTPLVYTTDAETVVNRARVERVCSLSAFRSGKPPTLKGMRASPVADSRDGLGAPFPKKHPGRWEAFGGRSGEPGSFPIGFAMASRLLVLGEGERTITLTFSSLKMQKGLAFRIALSGEEGWLEKNDAAVMTIEGETVLTTRVMATESAIVRPDPDIHGGGFDGQWPVMKVIPSSPEAAAVLTGIKASEIGLSVTVDRIENLELIGDLGPLSAGGGSFQPFGPLPAIGSGISIRSGEIESKKDFVTELAVPGLGKNWIGLPADWSNDGNKESFRATLAGVEFGLFDDTISVGIAGPAQYPYRLKLTKPDKAFGHSQYPALVTGIAEDNAFKFAQAVKAGQTEQPSTEPLPPEPYTPTLKSFTLGYTAELAQPDQSGTLAIFHLHPFGIEPVKSVDSSVLLPDYPDEGHLFIGLADLKPPETVSLHFAAIEGSGESLEPGQAPPEISWGYLARRGWSRIPGSRIEDETRGLLQPGVIALPVGEDAVDNNPLMPPGLRWICATVKRGSRAICKLTRVRAQAVRATVRIDDAENPPDHLRKGEPLPPGSVQGLVGDVPAIAAVDQPRTSFGGRTAEDEGGFHTRVSERLRHRNRAVTPWDYERLVLEAFPEIFKVMCLRDRATPPGEMRNPAEVTLVVIPRSAGVPWIDPLQPKIRAVTRERIREFLEVRDSGMVVVRVIDPEYEELRVSCRVIFRPGKSENDLRRKLNRDLKRFLSPWAYDEAKDVNFAGRLHRSVIEEFIENRRYVDHLINFALYHGKRPTPNSRPAFVPVEEAEPSHPWSILVSVERHDLK